MLESLFHKVAGAQRCHVISKRLQHRCFAVKPAKFLRTAILKNNWKRLLLFSKISQISEENTCVRVSF